MRIFDRNGPRERDSITWQERLSRRSLEKQNEDVHDLLFGPAKRRGTDNILFEENNVLKNAQVV